MNDPIFNGKMKTSGKVAIIALVIIVVFVCVSVVPIVPMAISLGQAAQIRNECTGGVGPNSAHFLIRSSLSYFIFKNFGVTYLPKGAPYPDNNASFYFTPFTSRSIFCG
jgi:hypothetical protein